MSRNYEKVFEYFSHLPSDVRMIMIDEMEPVDRCRFTRCSRSCSNEARKSKQYVYELTLEVISKHALMVDVEFCKNNDFGFCLMFAKESNRKYIVYTNTSYEEVWRIELDPSTDLVEFAIENFKEKLQCYQNTIKKLSIFAGCSEVDMTNYDFGIRHLNNLEVLNIAAVDIRQFLSKLKHPLKELQYWEESDDIFEQISQVQNRLDITYLKLNNEQFRQLSAKKIEMDIGSLTEKDVASFIESWQNGTVREDFEGCIWHLYKSDFNLQTLYRLLRIEYNGSQNENFKIKHNKEAGKMSQLCHYAHTTTSVLSFFVSSR